MHGLKHEDALHKFKVSVCGVAARQSLFNSTLQDCQGKQAFVSIPEKKVNHMGKKLIAYDVITYLGKLFVIQDLW